MIRPGRKAASPLAIQRGARLAQALRTRREEQGWSRSQLARAAGVEVETLRKIELGDTRDPGFFTVAALAAALDLDLADLAQRTASVDASAGGMR